MTRRSHRPRDERQVWEIPDPLKAMIDLGSGEFAASLRADGYPDQQIEDAEMVLAAALGIGMEQEGFGSTDPEQVLSILRLPYTLDALREIERGR